MDCLLSIVIPVYNTEKYLPSCLNSLLDQDLEATEFEIICVDDGSTDGCPTILDEYAEKYENIHVIHQKNGGCSLARNVGLSIVKGKYVWFVDSDDYVDKQCFGFLTKTMLETDADIFSVRYVPFSSDAEIPTVPGNYVHPTKKKETDIACSGIRIFRTAILIENNILWNKDVSYGEDVEFIFFVKMNSNRIIYNDSVSYYHRRWDGSATGNKTEVNRKKYLDPFYLLTKEYAEELGKEKYTAEQKKEIEDRKNLSVQAILMQIALYENQQTIDEWLNKLKAEGLYPYKKISYNLKPKISFKRTMMDWAQYFFPIESFYRFFVKIIKK